MCKTPKVHSKMFSLIHNWDISQLSLQLILVSHTSSSGVSSQQDRVLRKLSLCVRIY